MRKCIVKNKLSNKSDVFLKWYRNNNVDDKQNKQNK